jgi:hypothetical protein
MQDPLCRPIDSAHPVCHASMLRRRSLHLTSPTSSSHASPRVSFRGIDDLHRFCAFTLLSCDAMMTVNAMRQLSTGAQPTPNNAIHLAELSVPDRGCRPTTWTADLTANEALRECT